MQLKNQRVLIYKVQVIARVVTVDHFFLVSEIICGVASLCGMT
jgi:hypothetical protein